MPLAERCLWLPLKEYRQDFKFRRQQSVGPYIVDFYCPKAKLIIEVDGPSHTEPGAEKQDALRDRFMKEQGLFVLRFTNEEIYQSLVSVIERIHQFLSAGGNPL